MTVKTIHLGPVSANCFAICDEKTKVGAVIDAGDYDETLLTLIEQSGIKELKYILCTHAHFDHVSGVGRLKKKFPEAKILVGEDDAAALNDDVLSVAAFFGTPFFPCEADDTLCDGDEIAVGDTVLKVISAPGHTPGGVMFFCETENVIFTGDTLFKGSVGRTDLCGGDARKLLETLQKIKKLPADCKVFCGHGEDTDVGYELRNNMFLR